jgi:hypothetical protein
MHGKARLGQWVILALIVATAVSELALAGFSIQANRFKGTQITRVLLSGWLLWRVWDGAGWARWLVAVLCFITAAFSATVGLISPAVDGQPELVAMLIGIGVVSAAFGFGLASPWVGAYQTARRGEPEAEAAALANRNDQ